MRLQPIELFVQIGSRVGRGGSRCRRAHCADVRWVRRDAPDRVADVVGDQQRAALSIATPTGRPCASPSSLTKPVSTSTRLAGGLAVRERHEDHLVAAAAACDSTSRAAPTKAPLAIRRGQRVAGGEREAERRDVSCRARSRARSPSRRGPGRGGLHARVDVLAEIAVGPAVEAAVLHRRQVVGHEVAAELVALVDHRPQRAGLRARTPCRPDCAGRTRTRATVPVSTSISRIAARLLLLLDAVLADVAVRADRRIELACRRGSRSGSWSSDG